MKVVLKEIGEIEIVSAIKNQYGDIEVLLSNQFQKIAANYEFPILAAHLTEYDLEWYVVILFEIPCDIEDEVENHAVLEVENQDDIYRLNALL